MAKNSALKKRQKQETEEFEFSDMMMGSAGDEVMVGMMSRLIEASRHQMQIAIELTKLTVEKNNTESFKEEDIFSVFTRASKVVSDNSPIKELWEKMN